MSHRMGWKGKGTPSQVFLSLLSCNNVTPVYIRSIWGEIITLKSSKWLINVNNCKKITSESNRSCVKQHSHLRHSNMTHMDRRTRVHVVHETSWLSSSFALSSLSSPVASSPSWLSCPSSSAASWPSSSNSLTSASPVSPSFSASYPLSPHQFLHMHISQQLVPFVSKPAQSATDWSYLMKIKFLSIFYPVKWQISYQAVTRSPGIAIARYAPSHLTPDCNKYYKCDIMGK